MVAMQELIWEVKPDLIIEAGIAHGGSLILSASMLALLDMCDAIAEVSTSNVKGPMNICSGTPVVDSCFASRMIAKELVTDAKVFKGLEEGRIH